MFRFVKLVSFLEYQLCYLENNYWTKSLLHNDCRPFPMVLHNHFTYEKEPVKVNNEQVFVGGNNHPLKAKSYICGPTVYDDCHIGHAMAYIRFDIFRKVMAEYANVELTTVMNITDIDDKILSKADDLQKSFSEIGHTYYTSFLDDLHRLKIKPANYMVKVSEYIPKIIDYIAKLEEKGAAYISDQTNDVLFDTEKTVFYERGGDHTTDKSKGKKSPKDFSLWKSSDKKPTWIYRSPISGKEIHGRPGWHIECSVIASDLLGSKVDFHFGGKDLIFPHHYNESACCSQYFDQTSEPFYRWVSNWFHSSHIRMNKEKMSKSLGNVITIKKFLQDVDPNILRMLCCYSHYRRDFDLDNLIIKRVEEVDRRLKMFSLELIERILSNSQNSSSQQKIIDSSQFNTELSSQIAKSEEQILQGIADDFDLRQGLDSLLDLIKIFESSNSNNINDLLQLHKHFSRWVNSVGLEYLFVSQTSETIIKKQNIILEFLSFRKEIRSMALQQIKQTKANKDEQNFCKEILGQCDKIRTKLLSLGIVIADSKT